MPEQASQIASPTSGSDVVEYSCAEYQFDPSDTSVPPSTEVTFDYEIHNGIDVTVGDALRDVKRLIMRDIANRMGCTKTSRGRKLLQEDLSDVFGNVISLRSSANDLPDPDASGCLVDVETGDPTTCTPVSGGFTIYAKPGTSESSLEETSNTLKDIIQTSMNAGLYETDAVDKAIYIGQRDNVFNAESSSAPINAKTEETDGPNEGLRIAIYVLACACLVLICLLWFTWWTLREKRQQEKREHDEEMCFNKFMIEKEESEDNNIYSMAMAPPHVNDYPPESQGRPTPPPRRSGGNVSEQAPLRPRSSSRGNSLERQKNFRLDTSEDNGNGPRPRSTSRGSSLGRRATSSSRLNQVAPHDPEEERYNESGSESSASEATSVEDMTPSAPQRPPAMRSKSAPKFQSNSNRRPAAPSRKVSSVGGSVSSDSSDSSGSSSSDSETFNDSEQHMPTAVAPSRAMDALNVNSPPGGVNNGFAGYNKSMESLESNGSSAREERQKRMAQARARASKRRSC